MIKYNFNEFSIEIIDDPEYTLASTDNKNSYFKIYLGTDAKTYPVSKHGVRMLIDEVEINNCIVIGSGGATGIHPNSCLIDNDNLLLCCCDTIFCLELPDLNLKWSTKVDQATCFEIFKYEEDYIVHGELQVSKLNKEGQPIWQFGGADIFVSIENEEDFVLDEEGILLTDFLGYKYKVSYDGKLLWDTVKK